MFNPLVTIAIPTYKQSEYIIRAIESALAQDYKNIEIIISDDSPDNNTETLIQSYIKQKEITYIHNRPRLGRVANYRKSLYEYAHGEWFVNLDGDDYFIDNQFISKSIESINGDPEIVFTIAGGIIKHPDGWEEIKKIPGTRYPYRIIAGKTYFRNFALKRGFFHLTILYNTGKAKEIDFYRYNILSSDIESFLRLSLTGKVILLDRVSGVWFLHNNNVSSSANLIEFTKNTEWVDSVTKFGIENKKISFIYGKIWRYYVKQNELSGFFMRQITTLHSMKEKMTLLKVILTAHPSTFFFPIFIKKIIQYLFLQK